MRQNTTRDLPSVPSVPSVPIGKCDGTVVLVGPPHLRSDPSHVHQATETRTITAFECFDGFDGAPAHLALQEQDHTVSLSGMAASKRSAVTGHVRNGCWTACGSAMKRGALPPDCRPYSQTTSSRPRGRQLGSEAPLVLCTRVGLVHYQEQRI